MNKPISKHRKQAAAVKRAEREARQARSNMYIRSVGKGFHVYATQSPADIHVIEYVKPQNSRCQHCNSDTGSTRATNCTQCSTLKNAAHRGHIAYVRYGDLLKIFDKHSHLQEEAFLQAVKVAISEAKERGQQREVRQQEAEKKRKEQQARRKELREEQDGYLCSHGYNWKNEDVSTLYSFDQHKEYDPRYADWRRVLYAPDGKRLGEGKEATQQALAEIERGAEIVRAEIEAKRQASRIAKQLAEAEATARAEALEAERLRRALAFKEAQMLAEVQEDFDFDEEPKVLYHHDEIGIIRIIDKVLKGTVKGVVAAKTRVYRGGHDYDDIRRFFCENPEAAGLTRRVLSNEEKILRDFFG